MYTNNIEQLTSFIYFILTGIVLGIIFDVFRIARRTIKTSDFITNLEDVLFGLIAGVIILITIFKFNNGELRLYIFIGLGIGIILNMLFISKYFIKINVCIINFIKKVLKFLFKPIISFVKFVKKILFKPFLFVIFNIRKLIEQITKKLTINFKKVKKE